MMKRFIVMKSDLILILALLAGGWKYTYSIERILDIGISDESNYLFNGVMLLKNGFPLAEGSPLYAAWYFLLSVLRSSRIDVYYFNYKLLTVLFPVIIYLALRKYQGSQTLSAIVAFFFLTGKMNLPVWPKVSHFAMLIILLFLIISAYPKTPISRFALLSIGALLSAYVRPEFFLTFVCFSLCCAGFMIIEWRICSVSDRLAFIGMMVFSGILLATLGAPIGSGERSLLAFGQHFSMNWIAWTGDSSLSPWTNWDDILHRNFGEVRSVADAMLNNPAIFFKHVIVNLLNAPQAFMKLFIPFPMNTYKSQIIGIVILSIGVFFALRHRRYSRLYYHKEFLFSAACWILPPLLACIVIYPREHYLLLIGTLLLIAFFSLLPSPEIRHDLKITSLIIWAAAALAILPIPLDIFRNISVNRPNREIIRFIQSLHITKDVYLLQTEGMYSVYLGDNFYPITEYEKNVGFHTFRDTRNINMIMLNARLTNDTRFRTDQEWLDFLIRYQEFGYAIIDIPETTMKLILKTSLLPQS